MPQIALYRVEVRPKPGLPDPRGAAALREAESLALARTPDRIDSASVYLLEGELDEGQIEHLTSELLADPVTELPHIGATPPTGSGALIEVHPLPGVMDPDAEAVKLAVRSLIGTDVDVRTGRRYEMHGTDSATARTIAERALANTVIHAIHDEPYYPSRFPHGTPYELRLIDVPLRTLSDAELLKLSRDAHLFLSLEEMKAIQAEYRRRGRDPRDIELETIAQTWSEHCVHKTFKATIRYREEISDERHPRIAIRGRQRPGIEFNPDGSITIQNLLKSTVAAATHELIADGVDWCLSVFVDNSGVIAFDEQHAVCFKVETHNHPSAIEPYGGAATGIGGCIRDVIGTGLAAKPIASTDVFCVAQGDRWDGALPKGVLHPRRILTQVVAGVRDYGNRMGIPTLNGAVWFDDDYVANPLVFCGVVGVMPRDKIKGKAEPGDRIIAVGGRTGRDGIHGATFSSAELTDTHADEFSHAVQIGNAITEKTMLDAILKARDHSDRRGDINNANDAKSIADQLLEIGIQDFTIIGSLHINPIGFREFVGTADGRLLAVDMLRREPPRDISEFVDTMAKLDVRVAQWRNNQNASSRCLFNAITDCGAGGFSSAVGEMGRELGAEVHLDRAPLKYEGLCPTEIWISEAQERMILAVPAENVRELQEICSGNDVEMADLGHFGTESGELILNYRKTEVGRLSMDFLHDGLPETVREASWAPASRPVPGPEDSVREGSRRRGGGRPGAQGSLEDALKSLLAHPNIASKRWIIRQYDHEVQGRTVVKPLTGAHELEGPSDAAVITPVRGSARGLAIANGLATGLRDDPYLMALAAVDECVRNLVCVGADPSKIAILDNFCWPSCNDPRNLGALVRAAEGCYDAAKAYRTPFISGKDSLNNQFTTEEGRTIQIPYTLLISGMGIVADVRQCVTMDAKAPGNALIILGPTDARMGGSHYEMLFGAQDSELARVDLELGPKVAAAAAELIRQGLVRSAHDCSEGGLLVAAAEISFAGGLGLNLDLAAGPSDSDIGLIEKSFAETPSRYLLEIRRRDLDVVGRIVRSLNVPWAMIGEFNDSRRLTLGRDLDAAIEDLHEVWQTDAGLVKQ